MSKKINNPQLTITTDGERRRLNLKLGRTTIGRKSDNVVVISDPSVSGHHATIIIEGDDAFVEDRGSTNGTFVDKEKISMPHKLIDGTSIVVGLSTLVFHGNQSAQNVASQGASDAKGSHVKESAYKDTQAATIVAQPHLEFLAEDKSVLKTMTLDKTVNPLGRLGVGVAAISYGRNGWVLSPVDGLTPMLNGDAVTTTAALLKSGDLIALGDLQARFVI